MNTVLNVVLFEQRNMSDQDYVDLCAVAQGIFKDQEIVLFFPQALAPEFEADFAGVIHVSGPNTLFQAIYDLQQLGRLKIAAEEVQKMHPGVLVTLLNS